MKGWWHLLKWHSVQVIKDIVKCSDWSGRCVFKLPRSPSLHRRLPKIPWFPVHTVPFRCVPGSSHKPIHRPSRSSGWPLKLSAVVVREVFPSGKLIQKRQRYRNRHSLPCHSWLTYTSLLLFLAATWLVPSQVYLISKSEILISWMWAARSSLNKRQGVRTLRAYEIWYLCVRKYLMVVFTPHKGVGLKGGRFFSSYQFVNLSTTKIATHVGLIEISGHLH